jgi:formamidopyrimidine-DNA glycosylase
LNCAKTRAPTFTLLGHLGMTGRMFLARKGEPLPKHAAVIFNLGAKISFTRTRAILAG